MKIVDVHSHILPKCYIEAMEREGIDPIRIEGFPTPQWSPEAHCEFVEQAGIDYSVLTLSTPHLHFGDDGKACALARSINEETADFCAQHPERFGFCAALPTPCVEGSIAEAQYALDELGALGVKLPSNSNGVYLGDERFDDLFAYLDERQAVVIIHPSAPEVVPQNVFTSVPKPLFEYIADTTRAVLNLIATGTIEKYPHVKIVVPHAGSFLPLLAQRLVGISRILIPKGIMQPCDVAKSLDMLYFDIAGDVLPVWLDALKKVANPEHVMYGGDFPYTPAPQIIAKNKDLAACDSLDGWYEEVMHLNAEKLFGLQ